MVMTHSKLGMSKEMLATRVLPFLLPFCVEPGLSPSQFETLASLVGEMVTKVTSEHRDALRQLDAVRREAQQFDQALSQAGNPTTASLTDTFAGIELATPPKPAKIGNDTKVLSIQEKQKYVKSLLLLLTKMLINRVFVFQTGATARNSSKTASSSPIGP